ncbi:MAG: oligosaccharide flippase family protein, partial [Acidobacteriota bacterium]
MKPEFFKPETQRPRSGREIVAPASSESGDTTARRQPPAYTLAQKAIQGVVWTYASFVGSKLLAFASIVILARLLAPKEFGQVGFALLVIGYLDTIGDFGVSSALIYERKRSEQAANVAFMISLITGVLWLVLATSLAPL